ncbi:MAG: HAMP domain-containing histidine kinase [Deltaproteobacteria bacterium]|nr:HAMP domain-containing histidine kinase [Deltaproteobacteria bacterium]
MRLRFIQSGSFLSLVLFGFSLVLLPLTVAFVSAVSSLDDLATQTRQALYRTTGATNNSRAVWEQAIDMERKVRLFVVLGDPSARAAFFDEYEEFRLALGALGRVPVGEDLRQELDAIERKGRQIADVMQRAAQWPELVTSVVPEFVTLHRLAKDILDDASTLTLREAEVLEKRLEQARTLLTRLAVALLPSAALLAAGLAYLITRPVGQIHRAIHRLGEGDFSTAISVRGPRDLQELGSQLDWLRHRLVELEGEKRKLLAHVSHDLKTPLTAIREGTELLLEGVVGPVTPEQHEVAQIMHQNSVELQRLIENLLDLSTASARPAPLSASGGLEPLSLRALLEEVLADHKPALLKKEIRVESRLQELGIVGRAGLLRTVFDNLVGNAVKFTPSGGTLGVAVSSEGGGALVDVWDSGPGIEPADRERIFEPFFQGDVRGTGPLKGSGLGLSIASEHVKAHGGKIELVETSSGAHFRVTLPLLPHGAES